MRHSLCQLYKIVPSVANRAVAFWGRFWGRRFRDCEIARVHIFADYTHRSGFLCRQLAANFFQRIRFRGFTRPANGAFPPVLPGTVQYPPHAPQGISGCPLQPCTAQRPGAFCHKEMTKALGSIGRNINQIAKRVNARAPTYQAGMEEIRERLELVWQLQRCLLWEMSSIAAPFIGFWTQITCFSSKYRILVFRSTLQSYFCI